MGDMAVAGEVLVGAMPNAWRRVWNNAAAERTSRDFWADDANRGDFDALVDGSARGAIPLFSFDSDVVRSTPPWSILLRLLAANVDDDA